MNCIKTREPWDEDDDVFVRDDDALDREDSHELLTLHCGYPGCCMPGAHFPSECHNPDDMMALMANEYKAEALLAAERSKPRDRASFIAGYVAAKMSH